MSVVLQQATSGDDLPDGDSVRAWLQAAVDAAGTPPDREFEISVRIVDEAEGRQLNSAYRGRDYATNVLSFPADAPAEYLHADEPMPLGDLVVCAPVVRQEAADQGKAAAAHWAHLLVHGTLHLLGYDHEQDDEARAMESLETAILIAKGLPDPYAGDATD